jgi:hypothetical protein
MELSGRKRRQPGANPPTAETAPLELNEWHEKVWVKVHPLRDGGWASDFARELCTLCRTPSTTASDDRE